MIKNANLDKAFEELNSIGYFAKRNWECCRTCGWYAVPDENKDNAVFMHEQDEEFLDENGTGYLAWSGNGKVIVGILEKNGVSTDWDGDEDTRIRIFAEDERTEEELEADWKERWGSDEDEEETSD